MKTIVLFLMVFSLSSFAQEDKLSISAHFGPSFSNWMFNNGESDFITCYNAGIEIRHRHKQSNFHFQSGLRWNEFGFKYSGQSYLWNGEYYDVTDFESKLTYFYLTLPFITTYKFEKKVTGLTLSAGPQLSFFLFNKSKYNDKTSFKTDQAPILNLNTFFSAGYEQNIGKKWVLGTEVYTNLNFPFGWFYAFDGFYNFGVALTGRYILK